VTHTTFGTEFSMHNDANWPLYGMSHKEDDYWMTMLSDRFHISVNFCSNA
jgi:hypothetical protein